LIFTAHVSPPHIHHSAAYVWTFYYGSALDWLANNYPVDRDMKERSYCNNILVTAQNREQKKSKDRLNLFKEISLNFSYYFHDFTDLRVAYCYRSHFVSPTEAV